MAKAVRLSMVDEILVVVVAGNLRSFSMGSVYLYVALYHAHLADHIAPTVEPWHGHLGHCVCHYTALDSEWKAGKLFTIVLPLARESKSQYLQNPHKAQGHVTVVVRHETTYLEAAVRMHAN